MIRLYGLVMSNNVNKVRYCLNKIGLEFEWIQTNPIQGENQSTEFLNISPSGKIPALEADGLKLFESNAINKYLARKHDPSLYPENPEACAGIDMWMDFCAIHVFHAMSRVLFNKVMAPMIGRERDEASLQTGLQFIQKYLPILDKRLSESQHIGSEDLSIADFNLLSILDPFELMKVDLSPFANVVNWRNRLMSEDWYQKCYSSYSEFVRQQMVQMGE